MFYAANRLIYSSAGNQKDHNSSCLKHHIHKFKHQILNLALAASLASTFNKFRLCPDLIQIMGKPPTRSKHECDECTIGDFTIFLSPVILTATARMYAIA